MSYRKKPPQAEGMEITGERPGLHETLSQRTPLKTSMLPQNQLQTRKTLNECEVVIPRMNKSQYRKVRRIISCTPGFIQSVHHGLATPPRLLECRPVLKHIL